MQSDGVVGKGVKARKQGGKGRWKEKPLVNVYFFSSSTFFSCNNTHAKIDIYAKFHLFKVI